MLMPSLGHHTVQKRDGKKDVVGFVGLSGFKIIFIFLTKTVVVQVSIFIIEVRETGF